MIHPKSPSPSYNRLRQKRQTNSGRSLTDSAQTIQLDARVEKQAPKEPEESEEPGTLGFFESIEHEKAQAEMAKMLEKRKLYPIAPDALIPNSTIRSMFKMRDAEPIEVKMFRLRLISPATPSAIQTAFDERLKRYSVLTNLDGIHSTLFQSLNKLDILDNLQNKSNKNRNWQNDDDEWVELGDPEASLVGGSSKPTSAKKSKNQGPTTGTLISRQRDTIPDLFKRMRNEPWWEQTDDNENNNLRSMLLHLIEILQAKQPNSYESACNYVVDIFRTYGIEPTLVNQILNVLLDHLITSENDPLDVHTVRTIAQFMIERKNIIVPLLEYTLKCEPDNILRQETRNAVKFITDVNNSDDIDSVLDNISVVRDTAEDTFSLKTIIERIKNKKMKSSTDLVDEGEGEEDDGLHPLLKKISEERWYPRDNLPITLDSIIDAILAKLPNASKSMVKTLTAHLVQLHHLIVYSNEQFDRVANGLISLLSHNDADYRLIAATILADLGKETKAIDIALLNSFLNDPRILVRTECCDTLKKLTGIMSDTVLKDCAEDIPYIETLPEEDFTLKNYLKEKNRLPTPPPATTIDEKPSVSFEEDETKIGNEDEEEKTKTGNEDEDEEEEKEKEKEEEEEEEEEKLPPTNEDEQERSAINIDDTTDLRPPSINEQINKVDDDTSFVRSRSPSPRNGEQPSTTNRLMLPATPTKSSITTNVNSSTAPIAPIDPSIRVEINEKQKSLVQPTHHGPKPRKEHPPQPSQTPRQHRQPRVPTEQPNRTPIKITVTDQSSGKRHLLLPNNSDMWDSYAKQNEIDEENRKDGTSTEIKPEQQTDPILTIINDHKRHIGYYRMKPNRPIFIPHKISFDNIFGDESHMTVDRQTPFRSTSFTKSTMQLSDLNRNKRHLHEVEFVQLLSSLLIRSIQVHRKHERFIPGAFSLNSDSLTNFTDALNISQIQLHAANMHQSSFYGPSKLPPIGRQRPTSAQMARMKSDAYNRAARAGVNLRKAQDMEHALSSLLKTDREQTKSTYIPNENTPHPSIIVTTTDQDEVTHAWLLEQLLKSQGTPDSQNCMQQISRAYPKFAPLLHSRIPRSLIPVIWNDPVIKQLAAIISNKQDDSTVEEVSTKRSHVKPSIPTFDDEHSSNLFDYSAPTYLTTMQRQQRDEHKKKPLPPVRGLKMRLPRHVLKFGYRELEVDSPEVSLDSLRDESTTKSRRRRIYMHLMMSVNENMFARHELVKSQFRHLLKTDYTATSFLPIIARPPLCN